MQRKTYLSEEATYDLDPSKVMEVVDQLFVYVGCATDIAQAENPEFPRPKTSLNGSGRTFVLNTPVENPDVKWPENFELAELVQSENGQQLSLKVNAHPKVAINPSGLSRIASDYKL